MTTEIVRCEFTRLKQQKSQLFLEIEIYSQRNKASEPLKWRQYRFDVSSEAGRPFVENTRRTLLVILWRHNELPRETN
jgi:protease II